VMMPAQVAAEAQSPSRPTLVWLGMGGLVVLLLGLLLLRSTVPVRRTRGLASLRLGRHGNAASGTGNVTIVRGAALQHGVERDLERIAGVERAQVVLEGSAEQLLLRVGLDVDVYADLSRIQARVQGALQRLATTAGSPPSSVEVLVHVQERRGRVRARRLKGAGWSGSATGWVLFGNPSGRQSRGLDGVGCPGRLELA